MSSELQLDVCHLNRWRCHLVNAYEVEMQAFRKVMAAHRRDDLKSHLQANCLYTGISSGPNSMGELYIYLVHFIIVRVLT